MFCIGLVGAVVGLPVVQAQPASGPAPAATPAAPPASAGPRGPAWIGVPRIAGRLTAADIGLVINIADPYSVAVGAHYIRRRGLTPQQVLRISLPTAPVLGRDDFERLRDAVGRRFDGKAQALALAWVAPYAVECNSITGALALGLDSELCKNSCGPSRPSRYFNSPSFKPMAEVGFRPSMLLAAASVEQAKALIDRGVASDSTLARRGRPTVTAMMLLTDDVPRRVRTALYPPAGVVAAVGLDVRVEPAAELARAKRVFLVSTGSVNVPAQPPIDWLPGGLGDHLTSYGGDLLGPHGQGTALDWIASGATASHGAVTEPCNHLQKFPHPQVLLMHYLQGSTAIEAYWKSVAWPQQALFIGEPLAAPFSPPLRGAAPVPDSTPAPVPASSAASVPVPSPAPAPGSAPASAASAAAAAASSEVAPVPATSAASLTPPPSAPRP